MDINESRTVVTVPAGEYFITDPCYIIRDEVWMGWLQAADYTNVDRTVALFAQIPGSPEFAAAFSTAYGDGTYPDSDGNEYDVDAGLIGIVPVSYDPDFDGVKVTFDSPVECYVEDPNDAHFIVFGHVRVRTGDTDEICEECGERVAGGGFTCTTCNVPICALCVDEHEYNVHGEDEG